MLTIASHRVLHVNESIRLSDYCLPIFEKYIPSRKGIKKAFKNKIIYVDGKVGCSGDWVEKGQLIELKELDMPPPKPYSLDFDIIYEDDHFAVINKPAGISVSGNQFNTIQNAIVDKIKPSKEHDALKWARPVHRLDNPTSGLLLIAKTASSIINLSEQFEKREIKKEYTAIIHGNPPNEGKIMFPIGQKEAISVFKKLQAVPSLEFEYLTLISLSPQTGRTHQLRIHCAKEEFPIVGDKLYIKGKTIFHKGLFLAATSLDLKHPNSGETMQFNISPPSKFESLLKREERRWSKYN